MDCSPGFGLNAVGTQHANEVNNNALLVGKFDGSYPIFARGALRAAHDAISGETLDFLRGGKRLSKTGR
jgi:hypothetical protein